MRSGGPEKLLRLLIPPRLSSLALTVFCGPAHRRREVNRGGPFASCGNISCMSCRKERFINPSIQSSARNATHRRRAILRFLPRLAISIKRRQFVFSAQKASPPFNTRAPTSSLAKSERPTATTSHCATPKPFSQTQTIRQVNPT